jgi:preprotein translocase subunit YajC
MDMQFWTLQQQEPAPAGAEEQAVPRNPMLDMLTLVVPMIVIMYFFMIRPQRRQQQEHKKLLENLKKNDHVVTSGGIFGIVDRVKDANEVILKIDEKNDVRIRVAKSAIAAVVKASGAEGEPSPEAKEEVKQG